MWSRDELVDLELLRAEMNGGELLVSLRETMKQLERRASTLEMSSGGAKARGGSSRRPQVAYLTEGPDMERLLRERDVALAALETLRCASLGGAGAFAGLHAALDGAARFALPDHAEVALGTAAACGAATPRRFAWISYRWKTKRRHTNKQKQQQHQQQPQQQQQ